jgi:hypothetical protein
MGYTGGEEQKGVPICLKDLGKDINGNSQTGNYFR